MAVGIRIASIISRPTCADFRIEGFRGTSPPGSIPRRRGIVGRGRTVEVELVLLNKGVTGTIRRTEPGFRLRPIGSPSLRESRPSVARTGREDVTPLLSYRIMNVLTDWTRI